MEKIQELVNKGELSKTLMADKEFVEGAKEIFKSEKVEMDDKKLAQLINEIESQLEKSNILDDKSLEEVSGGITGKGIARGLIKTVTTVAGTATGMFVGAVGGTKIGNAVTGQWGGGPRPGRNLIIKPGMLGGGTAGGFYGGRLGLKFGNYICKKTGLNEE